MSRDCPSRSALPVRLPRLLRPLLTSRSGSTPSGLRPRGEISPGKNALLHRTAVASTSPRLDHKSFANICPLALLGAPRMRFVFLDSRFTLHACFPRSVALTQLRFTSLTVVSSREDLHLQDCAHAGRTNETRAAKARVCLLFGGVDDIRTRDLRRRGGRTSKSYAPAWTLDPCRPFLKQERCTAESATSIAAVSRRVLGKRLFRTFFVPPRKKHRAFPPSA